MGRDPPRQEHVFMCPTSQGRIYAGELPYLATRRFFFNPALLIRARCHSYCNHGKTFRSHWQ
eukprot:934243-Prorocentrum_lima.AAC.1